MKKDIVTLAVEQVAVVATPRTGDAAEQLWDIHLVNEGDEIMENVLVSSRGFGELDGREKTTTTLRYFFQEIPPKSSVVVEPIQPALFAIDNEYWVSFNQKGHMLDRKYLFPAKSIDANKLDFQSIINLAGISAK
ncbi:MAG: hypothetical protein AAF828_11115 [Bacteroidota bacterium]